ncbi:energy transducer TonB [Sphingomicrobium sediminis]|uniref:Energy transducer TonB n=1 Tax=Sphingomicrobium sediminis TaxID=2950949 RepID=A0A9X2J1Y3_9SPHN|nr:energy transducer TonB [Sphingomicrobium sediminis]MCM8556465.1 energy transducer TonB [Sphingomicrobium sediminis]
MLRLTVGAAALLTAMPAQAQPLEPSSRWQVDFGETECLAIRKYGEGAEATHLVIKPYATGDRFEIALIDDRVTGDTLSQGGTMRVGDDDIALPGIRFSDDEAGRTVTTWFGDDLSALSGAEQVDLELGEGERSLKLTQATAVVDALQECRTVLADRYNMSGNVVTTPPQGNVDVLRDEDYPLLALDEDQESVFRALLLLDEEGNVAECSLLSFAGDALFVARSCGLIRERARFEPAIGPDGTAVRSAFVTPVVQWRLGKEISNQTFRDFERRDRAIRERSRGPGDSEGVLLRPPGERPR